MKKQLLTLLATIILTATFGQNSTVTNSNITRAIPKVGHMLNYLTKPSWTNQSFIDSVQKLNIEIIRYPGGTESQYFDWETGRSVPASLWSNGNLFNHSYIGTVPHISYPLSELLYFYNETNIKPIFCLNMLTKTLDNQIQMLQTASTIGIPVEYIELGNELYFTDQDFVNKYPTPLDYVLDVKNNWLPQLNALFPDAKIAVIGGYDGIIDLNGNSVPNRITTWNSSLFSQNPTADAITFHYYFPPNTTSLSNLSITQALAAPFRHWPILKANTIDTVDSTMECWITEYNLNDGNQTTYAIASSWTHALYTASIFTLMLEEPKIKMLLNHQITGSPSYASLASYTTFGDTITNKLTAEGNAMRLLHKAIKNSTTATKLNFSNNPNIIVNTITYPSLLGWIFNHGDNKSLYILNLSNSNFTLNLNNVLQEPFEYEQISSLNPLQKDITTENLIINKNSSTSSIETPGYSLTYIKNISSLHFDENSEINKFSLYPNPVKNKLIIKPYIGSASVVTIEIYDTMGKCIQIQKTKFKNNLIEIELEGIPNQLLLIRVTDENQHNQLFKILKE